MSHDKKSRTRLRNMSDPELVVEEQELRAQVWKLKLQKVTGQSQDPTKTKLARRELARLLTIRREREIEKAGEGRR